MNCSAFVPKNHSPQVDEVSDSLTSRGLGRAPRDFSAKLYFSVRACTQNASFRRMRFSSPAQTWRRLTKKCILGSSPHGKAHSVTRSTRRLTEKRILRSWSSYAKTHSELAVLRSHLLPPVPVQWATYMSRWSAYRGADIRCQSVRHVSHVNHAISHVNLVRG